ncbi:hypothetical protein B0O99DRAFT_639356 [Bisporella sp. PMI_857]|nr:hypothetical protein B0O99DRAFT_639356 [Bisporella sp. PMI_857]
MKRGCLRSLALEEEQQTSKLYNQHLDKPVFPSLQHKYGIVFATSYTIMPERRAHAPSTSSTRSTNVRRNLFHQHLSRRPTTSSTSTSAETLRLDNEHESETSDIVIRDKNGDFEVLDASLVALDQDEAEEEDHERREDEKERQRLSEAVKHHQRDRNRAPSEPADLLEQVKNRLRTKVTELSEDNWMYEKEDDNMIR